MKVSIITISYNSSATIRDTLQSVLDQDYPDYEHIIVDCMSTDGTLDIIKKFEPSYNGKLKWISEKDQGIYDGMNKGISMASGDVIGILNSDDFFNDSKCLAKICMEIEDVDAVYGDLVYVNRNDTGKIVRVWKGSQHKPGSFLKGWHPAHPTFYVRRACYEKFGNYDISFDVSADFELMLRFFEKGKISNRYIPSTLIKMRMGGESTGSIGKIIKGNKNVLRAFKKNGFKTPPFYLFRRLLPKVRNLITNKFSR